MNQIINYQEYPQENRIHKSTLFCRVFQEKKDLLDLYNGVNGTNYQNPDELEVNTLENVVYLSMKNDLSFLIDCNMNLYEHQSTYNPNMPLRGLIYFAQLYNKYISQHNINIYSSTLQKLPIPQYIVFYNGKQEEPDEQILLLSESFQESPMGRHVDGCLECEARMLNINYGHNRALMEKCKKLMEYAIFVSKVRQYTAEAPTHPERAITKAVDECISEGILEDILSNQRAEVLELVLTTFNKELYEQGLKEDAIREGHKEGFEKGHKEGLEEGLQKGLEEGLQKGSKEHLAAQVQKKLAKNKTIGEIADALEEDIAVIRDIIEELESNK